MPKDFATELLNVGRELCLRMKVVLKYHHHHPECLSIEDHQRNTNSIALILLSNHGGGSIMVWGSMSFHGLESLNEVQGKISGVKYLDLIKTAIPASKELINFLNNLVVFQQDNTPVHTANIVQRWFHAHTFPMLLWPA